MLKYIRADLPHRLGGDSVSPEAFSEIITELSGAGMDIFSARHADASGESAVCENGKGVQFFRICLKCLADKKMRVLQRIGKWNAVAQIVLHRAGASSGVQARSVQFIFKTPFSSVLTWYYTAKRIDFPYASVLIYKKTSRPGLSGGKRTTVRESLWIYTR